MRLTIAGLSIIILLFGFLTGSTFYFYNKSRSIQSGKTSQTSTFQADLPREAKDTRNEAINSQTKPAEPKGRVSYPANIYVINPKESLVTIGDKLKLPWQLLKDANGFTNDNLIQADYPLVIPKLNKYTDYYRIEFILNEDKASELNRETRDQPTNELFDPVTVAKKSTPGYFSVSAQDSFTLLEQDLSKGTAVVEAKNGDRVVVIGLIQPKIKGEKGFWVVLYVEKQK